MHPNKNTDISIIIPAKDEESRLPVFLSKVIDYCQKSFKQYEIIVVDDGSADKTSAVAQNFQSQFAELKVITLKQNRGKGYAVKSGFWQAKGDVVLFFDADGSTPVDAVEKNLHYLDEGFDIVIGSRVLSDSEHVVQARLYRQMIGRVFNFLVHQLLFKNIEDTQCGFKMFKKETIRPLFSRMNINGFGFDLEILYLAHKLAYRVKEVPVNWHHVDESKINLVTDSFRMFINIFQARNWHFNPINQAHQFMSPEEVASMAEVEQNHWWFQSENLLVKELVKDLNQKFDYILNAGCGTGLNLTSLKEFGRCVGCDVVADALSYCQKNGGKDLVQCNLEGLSFKDKKFDLITVLDVIEQTESPEETLSQLRRVLADDGAMIVTVPAFKFLWSPHDEALSHLRRYQKKELIQVLTEPGFQIEKVGYFFFASFLGVVPIRLFRKLFRGGNNVTSDTAQIPSRWLNEFLKRIFQWEIRLSQLIPLPFGTTLYAVVKKDKSFQDHPVRIPQVDPIVENTLMPVIR